ncbi:DNA recombinase/resolvase [Acetobacter orientalis]|uniref:DNA recombinase/resolvase n=1 Tax=Acetobacter orientalis TaxID=146474 RepID=A0A2Z5ZIR0_9PROT|nr:DNA recombinase/resolvase [Acetobacter orientalis]
MALRQEGISAITTEVVYGVVAARSRPELEARASPHENHSL